MYFLFKVCGQYFEEDVYNIKFFKVFQDNFDFKYFVLFILGNIEWFLFIQSILFIIICQIT